VKIFDVPMQDLETIAREVGVTFEGSDESNSAGYRVRGRLIPDRTKPIGARPFQRVSASIAFNEGRRVFAVCWHGHRDFMAKLFASFPNARIQTAIADYRGIADFDAKYIDTAHKNVGSMMFPVSAWTVCECCENYSYGPALEIGDSEYLTALAHAEAEDGASVIDESAARKIAADFHGGQFSDLYAFASSGFIGESLASEIESDLRKFTEPENVRQLKQLLAFVLAHIAEHVTNT
jgi:hypothetical protein